MSRKVIENLNQCSLIHAMNILGGRWKIIILYLLGSGKMRYGRFFVFLPKISRKVLTDQLRELEEDGLIIRKKYAEIPPRVEYSLSEKGKGFLPVLLELSQWTKKSYPDIEFEKYKIDFE